MDEEEKADEVDEVDVFFEPLEKIAIMRMIAAATKRSLFQLMDFFGVVVLAGVWEGDDAAVFAAAGADRVGAGCGFGWGLGAGFGCGREAGLD